MAKIINLKTARKQMTRKKKAAQASENAAKFGRTSGQKEAETAAAERQRRRLDQAEIESPPSGANDDTNSP